MHHAEEGRLDAVNEGAPDLANSRFPKFKLKDNGLPGVFFPHGMPLTQCESLDFCDAALGLSSHYHSGPGRLDQCMWPYLKADLETGGLDEWLSEQLLAEIFIILNKDSDLYPDIKRGDNGQAMMLGGMTRDNQPAVNPMTRRALRDARSVAMIDPKINLRIDGDTDMELLEAAARPTVIGLGIPPCSNDEVVLPGLIGNGHEPARADTTVRQSPTGNGAFEDLIDRVAANGRGQLDRLVEGDQGLLLPPALAAVKKLVLENRSVSDARMLAALETEFAYDEPLRRMLREYAPKLGNNHPDARAGSGPAMYCFWLASGHKGMLEIRAGATADVRKEGEMFSSSRAPSNDVQLRGPLSVLHRHAKIGKPHPERHRNLMVRVRGWGGCLREIDEVYQDQIISRHVYGN